MSGQGEDSYLTVIKNRKDVWEARTHPEVFMSSKNYQRKVKNFQMFMVIKKVWYLKSKESDERNEIKDSDNSSDIKSLAKEAGLLGMNIFFSCLVLQLLDTLKK